MRECFITKGLAYSVTGVWDHLIPIMQIRTISIDALQL